MHSKALVIEPTVKSRLAEVEYPLAVVHVDFALQVIPRFENTRPWQHLPFQWNAQLVQEGDQVEHRSWQADGKEDPRPGFVRSLVEEVGRCGTLVLHTQRLESVLKQMLEDLPSKKSAVRALLHLPVLELDHILKSGVYHPDLHGRFGLDDAMHALVPDLAAGQLEIQTAEAAAAAFNRLMASRTRATTREKLGKQLAESGRCHSLGMWEMFRRLRDA